MRGRAASDKVLFAGASAELRMRDGFEPNAE
jgi:hypothetical protein